MKISNKRIIAIGMSVLLVFSLTACGKSGGNVSKDGKLEKVVLGTEEIACDECIARKLDYFSKEMGIEVEVKDFDSGKDLNTALAAGSIDFALMGTCPASLAISQNIGVEFIWIHDVIGVNESLLARKETGIKTLEDLKGKTIATPFASTCHYELLQALASKNIKETDVNLLDMQTSEIYAAWKDKQIDAAYIWEPTLSQLTDHNVIYTSEDGMNEGHMTADCEVVRAEFAKEHPEIVSKYIKCCQKAMDYYKSNEKDAITTIADALQLEYSVAEKIVKGNKWLSAEEQLGKDYFGTSKDKGKLANTLHDTALFLKDQGSISDVPKISVFEQAVNSQYIEDALKE